MDADTPIYLHGFRDAILALVRADLPVLSKPPPCAPRIEVQALYGVVRDQDGNTSHVWEARAPKGQGEFTAAVTPIGIVGRVLLGEGNINELTEAEMTELKRYNLLDTLKD